MHPLLELKNISASTGEKTILDELSLSIGEGETHAIMGPNGAGKSTLASVLAGHPDYEVDKGEILFAGKDLLSMDPADRAHAGLFMSFQYPIELPGITNREFLEKALQEKQKYLEKKPLEKKALEALLEERLKEMNISSTFLERGVNVGFSGGEKKKNELLQMALLQPKLAILDETDSGLDVDALKLIGQRIHEIKGSCSLIIITHYAKLLELIQPDHVHVMMEGKIVRSGSKDLAKEIEELGYAVEVS